MFSLTLLSLGCKFDLVNIRTACPKAVIELRYATMNNVFGKALYTSDQCLISTSTAKKLDQAIIAAATSGLQIKVFDAYRPPEVTSQMWKLAPDRHYFANPKRGSVHNKGRAVDLTLLNSNGTELDMGTHFDSLRPLSGWKAKAITIQQATNRSLLKSIMTSAGFKTISTEWWHWEDRG